MIDANVRIIEELKEFVTQLKTNQKMREAFLNGIHSFTRDRILTLERLIYFIINMPKRSLNIELPDFFQSIDKSQLKCTKSALSIQRNKLKSDFFSWWNSILVNSFYRNHEASLKRWKGLRVIAVDGSTAYLINTPEVIEYFGVQSNHCMSVPMARIMGFYDVLNDIIVGSAILPIKFSEPAILNALNPCFEKDMLAIYDRGFPSFATIFLHLNQEQEIKFVMRCTRDFNNLVATFVESDTKSKIVEFKPTSLAIKELKKHQYIINSETTVKVRLVKVILDTGETEVLITNLYDESEYPNEIFKDLYFKRWGIETHYDRLKNKFQLEQFSGQKVNNILQDFYATIFVCNLQSLISKQCDEEVELKTSHRKYKYKINVNISIGIMKNRIVKLFIEQNPDKILAALGDLFSKNLEPIRPDRKYERKVKYRRLKGKYQTLTNYKRAI